MELSLEQRAIRAIVAEAFSVDEEKIRVYAGSFELPDERRFTLVSEKWPDKEIIELDGGLLLYEIG